MLRRLREPVSAAAPAAPVSIGGRPKRRGPPPEATGPIGRPEEESESEPLDGDLGDFPPPIELGRVEAPDAVDPRVDVDVALGGGGIVGAAAAGSKPNFIVIMVDDMGYAGPSCFGNPYFKTPEMDRLAAEGMRFTDFHSSGTVCSPTRTGLLTGRYQQRAGIEAVIHPVADHPEHWKGLQKSEHTFAEMLQREGYVTGLVGKWHQGYPQN